MAINRNSGRNQRKGAKPMSLAASAGRNVRRAKSKPKGKSAKVLPRSERHRRKGKSESPRW